MKVLILDSNIFGTVGGGQHIYRGIIEQHPEIQFSYFSTDEEAKEFRPSNTRIIHRIPETACELVAPRTDLTLPIWIQGQITTLNTYLRAVAGESFDIIDIPDYVQFGAFLRPALRRFGIRVGKIALALHGSMSTSLRLGWGYSAWRHEIPYNLLEWWQYATADVRYAISPSYKAEWESCAPYPVQLVDLLKLVPLPTPIPHWNREGPINLVFLGRPELRKGPDIFLSLIGGLNRSLFGKGMMYGPDCPRTASETAIAYITRISGEQHLPVEFHKALTPPEIDALLAERTVVFTPSRYDSLNLVAFHSTLSGCPTVIGDGAGIGSFLHERYPDVPFVSLSTTAPETSIPAIESLLRNYDTYRENLVSTLHHMPEAAPGLAVSDAYGAPSIRDEHVQQIADNYYAESLLCTAHSTQPIRARLRLFAEEVGERLETLQSQFKPTIWKIYDSLATAPEGTEEEIFNKWQLACSLSDASRIDRVRVWREIARLERMRGNSLLWATYEIRAMRSLGVDHWRVLPDVVRILEAHQFPLEAAMLSSLYGRHNAEHHVETSLYAALENHRQPRVPDFEAVIDHRTRSSYRVSVIVSMYNAASKLELFLRELSKQSLNQERHMEMILVDSGSPTEERQVFETLQRELPFEAVYVRSTHRETIQTAWNQGIALSRSPYLAFLGVDETVREDAFQVLAAALDDDPKCDWVIGSSTVTEVDKAGEIQRRCMDYNREHYRQDFVYLETCYLSWVGALYRKSVHERFGYYDGTFRAAGDTEFKNRVLPFIHSKAIPEMLGIFLNYPEERTTASPLAEIEDIRAWYAHRSLGGVRYGFSRRSPAELAALVYEALSYRKSYHQALSTDFDYAVELLRYLKEREPKHQLGWLLPEVVELRDALRTFDYFAEPGPIQFSQCESAVRALLKDKEASHRARLARPQLTYDLFNDNRYEQHHWPWRAPHRPATNRREGRYVWN